MVSGGLAAGCASKKSKPQAPPPAPPDTALMVHSDEPSALQKQLAALAPASDVASEKAREIAAAIDSFHQNHPTRRGYIAVDKPLYRPGETVWFRAFDLATFDLGASQSGQARFQLISPKGAAVLHKRVRLTKGNAAGDFAIPRGVPGGEYIIAAVVHSGARSTTIRRPIIVSSYQPPRIKKVLKFLRKAYGEGDKVAAALALHRATGEALRSRDVTGVVTLDGTEIARLPLATDVDGKVVVRFDLPDRIAVGDGLLTVLVADGGVTESIQKRIPITLKTLSVSLYPEGGQLVDGLPGRVYLSAKNAMGKPADVEGRVVDDTGRTVAAFRSLHDGLGRFEITPSAAREYKVEITKPVGIERTLSLPPALSAGCSMQSVDDFAGARSDIRVGVWCKSERTVIATGSLREKTLATTAVRVGPDAPTVVALPLGKDESGEGAVRVTLFGEDMRPLAERLVYRTRAAGPNLDVRIRADRESYNPRDRVSLTIETRDGSGAPVAADLALSVVDDTVLAFADDKTAALKARVLLEAEMPGQKVEEPNFYFSDDAKAPAARDLLLGTQGWRRFDWQPVMGQRSSSTWQVVSSALGLGDAAAPPPVAAATPKPRPEPARLANEPMDEAMDAVEGNAELEADQAKEMAGPPPAADPVMAGEMLEQEPMPIEAPMGKNAGIAANKADKDWDGKREAKKRIAYWAPVRRFPVPNYQPGYEGPRNDFRETIYWQPQVRTDAKGVAEVSFVTSDAITSFKAIAEGTGNGTLGRGESIFASKLPVSLAVKMPMEVSKGDVVRLPVTVSNESKQRVSAALANQIGPAFAVRGSAPPATLNLAAGERRSFFIELEVVGSGEKASDGAVRFSATAANLRDEVERTIAVSPRGFPQELSIAGTVSQRNRHEVVLPQMHAGSLKAELVMYPSPLATMIEGTEAIIREPTGCFEQASSANYPNVMVLDYLSQNGNADPQLVERTQGMLDRGYKKLTGYESPKKGYEWFGGDPGHEALTAYGLLEFVDMTAVYEDVDQAMIARTAAWLKNRRDGKGGYKRNSRALDSFGRASEAVTNAYITYALAAARQTGIDKELDAAEAAARSSTDPYVLALSAGALLHAGRDDAGRAAAKRLAAMQKEDGSFAGADHSITRSGGVALTIETTSLASLAMMQAGREHDARLRRAVKWLNDNRNGFGGYGSTQSTVLALKAMTTYASHSRQTRSAGVASVFVNGEMVKRIAYEKGHADALSFDLGGHLVSGKNVVEVALDGKEPLPYSMAVTYASDVPASSRESAVSVETALTRTEVPMGEGVTMKVRVKNVKKEGIPMAIARVGLPGGLTFQTWQLKELRDKKLIDFYETRDREVVLYFRSMAPERVAEINLELLASVPGRFTAPASRAYLYYTDEYKSWAEPVAVTVQ